MSSAAARLWAALTKSLAQPRPAPRLGAEPEPQLFLEQDPDVTGICEAKSEAGYICSQPGGHAGYHIARAYEDVCDTWPGDPESDCCCVDGCGVCAAAEAETRGRHRAPR